MNSTKPSSPSRARVTTRSLATSLCWIAVGFVGACAASPQLPWSHGAGWPAADAHAATPVGRLEASDNPVRDLRNHEPFENGGPSLGDSTEWMPGNR